MHRSRSRWMLLALAATIIGGMLVLGGTASAHECGYDPENPDACRDTPVMPNWRGTYIPLFELEDREDEQQRYDAQRWRDECDNGREDEPAGPDGYQSRQQCAWLYGGSSTFPNRDNDLLAPNELHAGFAATHCFLFEFAHQCEDHNPNPDTASEEGIHDAHGGALYVDVCLTENPESKYCDDGQADTQAGVTIMDHNPCGTVVPIVACTDEYHVIRPFDEEYTQAQMDNSAESTQAILDDPYLYLCGYDQYGDCIVPQQ